MSRSNEECTNIMSLSSLVMAKNILSFLDPKSVISIMSLEPLCQRLQLTDFYCRHHGTKLTRGSMDSYKDEIDTLYDEDGLFVRFAVRDSDLSDDSEYECESEASDEEMDLEDDSSADSFFASDQKLRCEDCVRAERHESRCSFCNWFKKSDDISKCLNCSKTYCFSCTCWMPSSNPCNQWCFQCDYDNGYYRCGTCRNDIWDFSESGSCGMCRKPFHIECMFVCYECGEWTCDVCTGTNPCSECGTEFCLTCKQSKMEAEGNGCQCN